MKALFGSLAAAIALTIVTVSPASAKWLPVQHVGSEKPIAVVDGDTGESERPELGYASSNWQASTPQAFSHAIALAGGHLYEFRLVRVKGSDEDSISGWWDIYRNGALACKRCVGKAYGLSGAIGDYFKIYVGTPRVYAERWHFSGYITNRFDY